VAIYQLLESFCAIE